MKRIINYRGIDIEIISDDHPNSPDDFGNDDCFIVYDHRQFYVMRKGFDPNHIYEATTESKKKMYDGYWVFPVDAYIHSGVVLSLARENNFPDRRWDVSTTGYVLVKKQKGWTWRKEKAREVARLIITEWNDYLSGNVWGYNIEQTNDSCWGFYGDYKQKDGCLSEAKHCVDAYIKRQRTSHSEKLKAWIKNKVPLIYRRSIDKILTN